MYIMIENMSRTTFPKKLHISMLFEIREQALIEHLIIFKPMISVHKIHEILIRVLKNFTYFT